MARDILSETVSNWLEDKAPQLGAAIAYYALFSLAPVLVIAVAIAGFIFGEEAARGEVVERIQRSVGQRNAQTIQELLQLASNPTSNRMAAVIGVAMLLIGAAGVFGQLQDSLNTIWKVKPRPGHGFQDFIRYRFLSFAMVLLFGFLLVLSLALTTILEAAGKLLPHALSSESGMSKEVHVLVSLASEIVLFALIFKLLPDVKLRWRDVWLGASVTAILYTMGKYGIGLYLAHAGVTSPYGAAGSLVAILVWIYYSAQILLLGAEFTRAYTLRRGNIVAPAENAIPTTGRP